jgi:hypothetical protein
MADTNTPSIDLTSALDPGALSTWIEYQLADHVAAIDALLVRYDTFLQVTVGGIADDFICGHASDLAKAIKGAEAATDKKRVEIKAPVLHAARLIDGAGKTLLDPARGAVAVIEKRITDYLKAKEAAARATALAEAERLALEAEAAIAAANESNSEEAIGEAVAVMDAATKAEAQASAPALELTRTRGLGGSITGLRDNWVWELVDITKVPTHLLMVNDSMAKAMIKGGTREIPGLRIWNDAKAYAR